MVKAEPFVVTVEHLEPTQEPEAVGYSIQSFRQDSGQIRHVSLDEVLFNHSKEKTDENWFGS